MNDKKNSYDEEINLNDYDKGYRDGKRALLLELLDKKGMVQSCIKFVDYLCKLEKELNE